MATARKNLPGGQAGRDSRSSAPLPRAVPDSAASTVAGPPAELGPAALRALAHPLRIRILDLLPIRGPLTASKLGEIVGESSGSTSYHLRQLAKHGLVREVEGKGTARERWWERTPGGFSISSAGKDSPAGRQTAEAVNMEFLRLRNERVLAFARAGQDADEETLESWMGSATFVTVNKWATREQAKAVVEAWEQFAAEHLDPLSGQEGNPGAVPFEIHFDVFPTIDPEGNPL
ncbi:helix-turn-helix domain-containing protein [Promicromonospora sp. NPDC023805]|uniref:ArsR/SmtB family transcription factor n=1 Tax=Promicromonospora sp. NPDC023805 TaxID=3154696 RepID=UPI00340FCD8E